MAVIKNLKNFLKFVFDFIRNEVSGISIWGFLCYGKIYVYLNIYCDLMQTSNILSVGVSTINQPPKQRVLSFQSILKLAFIKLSVSRLASSFSTIEYNVIRNQIAKKPQKLWPSE